MSDYVAPASTIGEAWLRTLELVNAASGRRVNVVSTVTDPQAPQDPVIRSVVDGCLVPGRARGVTVQEVDTVADTVFPHELYRDPGLRWSPDLDAGQVGVLDAAAQDLYEAYASMLDLLCTADGNTRGTYFGRMISWPGREEGGINQLADRIHYLRNEHRQGRRTYNLSDITIGGQAELADDNGAGMPAGAGAGDVGVQLYAAGDRRQRGFPCLVHVDLTLLDGQLSMLAVYRHQLLITKGYGNLLGLTRLLCFLAEQTGFEVGELAVHATLADAERSSYGGRRGVDQIIHSARPVDVPR